MSHSTPKLPLNKQLTKFIQKIDSFTFENKSPEFGSSSESQIENTTEPSNLNIGVSAAGKLPTTEAIQPGTSSSKDTETVVAASKEILTNNANDSSNNANSAASKLGKTDASSQTQDSSVVHLRRGRTYRRRRSNSTPSIRYVPIDRELRIEQIVKRKELNIEVVSKANKKNIEQIVKRKEVNVVVDKVNGENIANKDKVTNSNSNDQVQNSGYCKQINNKSKMEVVNNLLFNVVPLFTGERGEVPVFVNCSRVAYESLDTPESKSLFLKLLPTRLRNRALDSIQNITLETFEEFINFIESNFGEEKSYIELNNELRLMSQVPTETLSSYLLRVKTVLEQCKKKAASLYPAGAGVIAQELEEVAINSFKMGVLNPNHKFYLLQDTTNAIRLLEPIVKRLEQSEKYMFYTNPTSAPISLSNPSTNYPTGYFNHGSSTLNMVNTNNYNKNNREMKNNNEIFNRNVHCSFCKRSGHTYNECRKRNATPYCTICRTQGHSKQNCRQRQQNFQGNKNFFKPNQQVHSQFSRSKQVNLNQIKRENSNLKCDFCLQEGHDENNCIARERYEKRKLEERIKILTAGNSVETVGDPSTRL